MNLLDTGFYLSSAIALLALPFLIVNTTRYIRNRHTNKFNGTGISKRVPVKSTIFFVVPILVAILIAETMASLSRSEALTFIRDLSESYKVSVNRGPVQDPEPIIAALKQISPEVAHHSHPLKEIEVDIQTEKSELTLVLRRDSDFPREYWVYYPKYKVTSSNEIGRITTPVFDEY
jgi:hypothetical protein